MVELKAKEGFLYTNGEIYGSAVTCNETEVQKWYLIPIEDVPQDQTETVAQI